MTMGQFEKYGEEAVECFLRNRGLDDSEVTCQELYFDVLELLDDKRLEAPTVYAAIETAFELAQERRVA